MRLHANFLYFRVILVSNQAAKKLKNECIKINLKTQTFDRLT
jgi:hypothetical protein